MKKSNLIRTHGAMTEVTHEDLARLYSNLEELFGLKYLPEPVLAEAFDGTVRPVLCYIAPRMDDAPATIEYVGQLAEAARCIGLPEWYAELVDSFGPEKEGRSEQGQTNEG